MRLVQPVPDLVSLDLLQSVAELGSIRRAAAAHHISQPAASMRLRSLERTVGLQLLDRTAGPARLTPEGMAVVEWSERVIEGMHALVSGTQAMRTEGRSQLRLAASMTVAEYLIPRWLHTFRKVQPEVRVSLQMGNSDQVIDMVARQVIDLGFVEGRSRPMGLETRLVGTDELVVVVAKHHPWNRRRRPLSPEELSRTPLVLREIGSGTREVLEQALGELGLGVTPFVELGSTTAIKTAVASGTAPAVLSRLAVHDDLHEGRLFAIDVPGLRLERSIRAHWPRSRLLTEPAEQFLSMIGNYPAPHAGRQGNKSPGG